ncbi:putative hydroxypyruvate isomerase [Ciona intestinalis]
MGKLKFCSNVSWMYSEAEFIERFKLATQDGFKGVECAWPYDYKLEDVVAAKTQANLEQILINSGCAKSLGNAANSNNVAGFKKELEQAILYANALNCKRIHIVAGNVGKDQTRDQACETYVSNLQYAAEKLQEHGIMGLIEPINTQKMPDYFLNTTDQMLDILKRVNKPNIMYQLDIFHLQIMEGNLTRKITDLFPKIGHIQISQVPGRGEPSTAGEINFSYLFSLLETLGYDGWIGLEYKPSINTEESVQWFKDYMQA